MNLNHEDQLDVVILWLKQLNLLDALSFHRKAGQKLTSLATRKRVCEFWHSSCTYSTITWRPVKLRNSDKKYIQADLDFINNVTIISQRNKNIYESNWVITTKPYKQLFNEYLSSNYESPVSLGTFMALKPFYIRSATVNDIELCCCKKLFPAR